MDKENYFGMYLGQRMVYGNYAGKLHEIGRLDGIERNYNRAHISYVTDDTGESFRLADCKLILRPLSDMTEEENKIRTGLMINDDGIEYDTFESTEYLLEKGFDIFDLKSKGWAVYESDLKGEGK